MALLPETKAALQSCLYAASANRLKWGAIC